MTITIAEQDRQPIDWPVIEAALHDYVVEVLGIPFIFANQNVPQPAYPYASGSISAVSTDGEGPELRTQYNSSAAAGQEIDLVYMATFEFTFSISVHVDPASGAYDPLCDAKMMASKLQWEVCKETPRAILKAANLVPIEELALTDSSVVVNGEWLSRYTLDVRIRGVGMVSDTTGYIDKVEVTGTFPDHSSLDFTEVWDSTA